MIYVLLRVPLYYESWRGVTKGQHEPRSAHSQSIGAALMLAAIEMLCFCQRWLKKG